MNPALITDGLFKRFGPKVAVDSLSLQIPQGHLFGLVGPNGAGKTTAMSMICGLLRPDSGTARVLGNDVWADPVAAKKHIGVLPDGVLLFDRLSRNVRGSCSMCWTWQMPPTSWSPTTRPV